MNSDFQFLQNPISGKWVILAPRRAKRPDVAKGVEPVCPFCPGKEGEEKEVYRVHRTNQNLEQNKAEGNGQLSSVSSVPSSSAQDTNWLVRVLNNKFPFAPIHEIIIHSPDHHKNFEDFDLEQNKLILQAYKQRFLANEHKGQVYIFHNRGERGGESLPHAHTQLAVVPSEVKMDIPRLDPWGSAHVAPKPLEIGSRGDKGDRGTKEEANVETVETKHFYLFCPKTSQWPDEVWVAPKQRGRSYGEITEEEVEDLAFILPRIIKIIDLRHGADPLPFNFHIYPGGDWYLRFMPRIKTLGGFELGTGIYINTQDPNETIAFIKEHFENPDEEKIKTEHQAEYKRAA